MLFTPPTIMASRAAQVSYTDSTFDSTNGTSYSFSARAIGTASATRYVVVAVFVRISSGSAGGTSAVTIGGISAAQIVQTANQTTSPVVGLWGASVPSGTTATIAVTVSQNSVCCGIGVWALDGLSTATPTATGSSTSSPGAMSVNIPAGGVVVAAAGSSDTGGSNISWTNATERYEFDPDAAGQGFSGADASFATAQTSLSISAAFVSATNPKSVCAVFGP